MGTAFAKTPKGHEEITSKAGGLSPRVRRVLIFVDGKRTVDELRGMLQSDDLQHTLGMLEEAGYIELARHEPELIYVDSQNRIVRRGHKIPVQAAA